VVPTPAPAPQLLLHSPEVASLLGIAVGSDDERQLVADVFSGSRILPGSVPHAMNYGGHQFGNWAGQLGDGRAIALGEVIATDGSHQTLQLKGAGPTPYSRRGDGYAVLRSSLREFLCSEAMHHLAIPTTRALSLVTTGRTVVRDMLYDGNPLPEPGAVVCRVAPSFVRFGNFEIHAARDEIDLLRRLADHVIDSHFPELGTPSADVYLAWFAEVVSRTAALMVDWMRVGFVHGVMNTDNLSILGLTIDYGPYGWLEDFDPGWTPNTTDASGRRYRYGAQPQVALWNLAQLGSAIVPLVGSVDPLQDALSAYGPTFTDGWRTMTAKRLGLTEYREDLGDDDLFNDLLVALQAAETDMTIFFRRLADVPLGSDEAALLEPLSEAYYDTAAPNGEARTTVLAWLDRYARRVDAETIDANERRTQMNACNPRFVLRNYLAQLAIDAAEQGDPSVAVELLDTLRRPYDDQPGRDHLAAKRPEWARTRVGCSMLSCSS
jgi:serine/tyrosine/threonine adenylyltransferase